MFCSNCGKENNESSVYCSNCGKKLYAPQYVQRQPEPIKVNTLMQKPKKNVRNIVLVICIIVLCLAIICGLIMLYAIKNGEKKNVENFKAYVEDFEYYLDDVNYSSVQEEIVEIMEDCESAINNGSIEEFDKLKLRIRKIHLKLGDIPEDFDSLEQLKQDYEIIFDENFVIPEDILMTIEELFEQMHAEVQSSTTQKLRTYESKLENIATKLAKINKDLIEDTMATVEQMDLSDATSDERDTLNTYKREIEEYIDMGNYRLAFDKTLMYESYAREIESRIFEQSIHIESETETQHSSEDDKTQVDEAYICPGSDSRYLTEADLVGLSSWELLLARNEIFARHGRMFVDENIQAYFDSQSWYHGTVHPDNFNVSVFNQYELANIDFIKAHE